MMVTLRRALRICRFLLAALGALVLAVTFTPLVRWWATGLAGPWNDPGGDVLVILAAEHIEDTVIGKTSYWRAVYGTLAYRRGGFRRIVVSGKTVAPLMRDFLVSQGVPPGAITVENAALSTRENALFVANLLRGTPERIVLLTSDYHMFRAHRCFTKAGLRVLPRPFPDARKSAARWTGRFPAFLGLLEETAKIAYYSARGWI